MAGLWAMLREARYALPGYVERILPGPGPAASVRISSRLARRGFGATIGYFQAQDTPPEEIVAATTKVAGLLVGRSNGVYLSIKAHPLGFDRARLRNIADAAAAAGLPLLFDAQAPQDAGRVMEAVSGFLPEFPGTGVVLPARWRRSMEDAAAFRDTSARIRIVKGEQIDPEWGDRDVEAGYLALVSRLAGRKAPVAVATHDPMLAERALTLLMEAGTPCELEQLRGLPRRRTAAAARRLGVPVRVYIPFGPGWWSYALDKALDRPYFARWMIKDWLEAKAAPPARGDAALSPEFAPR